MKVKTNKIVAGIGILLLALLIGYWLYPKDESGNEYIFDKNYQITLEDVKKSRTPLPFEKALPQGDSTNSSNSQNTDEKDQQNLSSADLKKIFSEGLINSHTTLKYFKHLETMFKGSNNKEDHLKQVKNYLFSEFSEAEAQQLFETYKKYLDCQIELAEKYKNFNRVKSPNEAIEILKKIQEFRRSYLGDELADKLFGAEVKASEYAFRRADIVGDNNLYGKEKEELLKKLNGDMWGDEANAVEKFEPDTPEAWKMFSEKQIIYKKDLDEMGSQDARDTKVKEYRTEFFSPEVVKRLDEVDQQIAGEKQNESAYREKEKTILEDKSISDEDRNQKVKLLQDQTFGEEADAFRRRETMRIDLEKMMKEHPKKEN